MVVAQPEESFWKAVTCSTNCARASAPRQRSPFVQSPTGSAPSSTIALICPDSAASSASLGVVRSQAGGVRSPARLPAGRDQHAGAEACERVGQDVCRRLADAAVPDQHDLVGAVQRTAELGGRVGRGQQGRVRGAGGGRDVMRAAQRLQSGAADAHRDHLRPGRDRLADAQLHHRRALARARCRPRPRSPRRCRGRRSRPDRAPVCPGRRRPSGPHTLMPPARPSARMRAHRWASSLVCVAEASTAIDPAPNLLGGGAQPLGRRARARRRGRPARARGRRGSAPR